MDNKYKIKDILSAIDILLDDVNKKKMETNNQNKKPMLLIEDPLILKNETKNSKKRLDIVPKDTEKIILQAEKYLKK